MLDTIIGLACILFILWVFKTVILVPILGAGMYRAEMARPQSKAFADDLDRVLKERAARRGQDPNDNRIDDVFDRLGDA